MATDKIQSNQQRVVSLIGGGILLVTGIAGVIFSLTLVLLIQLDNFDYRTDFSNVVILAFGVGACFIGWRNFRTGGRLLLESSKLQLLSATLFAVTAVWLFMYYIFTGLEGLTF